MLNRRQVLKGAAGVAVTYLSYSVALLVKDSVCVDLGTVAAGKTALSNMSVCMLEWRLWNDKFLQEYKRNVLLHETIRIPLPQHLYVHTT